MKVGILMRENRYRLEVRQDESGATEYQIIDLNDMEVIESYWEETEANKALTFWNTGN